MADLFPVVEAELARLRAENIRLRNLLKMTPEQAAFFEAPPGMVHNRSPEAAKVAFFGALFAARTDIYATRWDNPVPRQNSRMAADLTLHAHSMWSRHSRPGQLLGRQGRVAGLHQDPGP